MEINLLRHSPLITPHHHPFLSNKNPKTQTPPLISASKTIREIAQPLLEPTPKEHKKLRETLVIEVKSQPIHQSLPSAHPINPIAKTTNDLFPQIA